MGLLLDHVLGTERPKVGDVWRTRKGAPREIIIDEVYPMYVVAHAVSGRRTTVEIDGLLKRYVKVPSE